MIVFVTGGAGPVTAGLRSAGLLALTPESCCSIPEELQLHFGHVIAFGDFNGDGWDELVVGSQAATVDGFAAAGRLAVLTGSPDGPGGPAIDLTDGILSGSPLHNDRFGSAIVAADFDGDGADDLAIGVSGDDYEGISAGSVRVIYGDGTNPGQMFQPGADSFSHQVPLGAPGDPTNVADPEGGDFFGFSLAAGDFDGDGLFDLAIGAPLDDVTYVQEFELHSENAGTVTVLFGDQALGLVPGQIIHRARPGVPFSPYTDESFGHALAAGDFDGDGDDELAIGAPGKPGLFVSKIGRVTVVDFDVDEAGNVTLGQVEGWEEGDGIPGLPEAGDRYGRSLAAGDFDGDGADDLAIGTDFEAVSTTGSDFGGALAVLHGQVGIGLEANATLYTQDDLPGQISDHHEYFGYRLAAGDFDADGADDLVVSAPGNQVFLFLDGGFGWQRVGSVHVIPGRPGSGLDLAGTKHWIGTPGGDLAEDSFGSTLAVASGGSGGDHLAIASTDRDGAIVFPNVSPTFAEVGLVTMLFSDSLFSDGFESGDLSRWDSSLP